MSGFTGLCLVACPQLQRRHGRGHASAAPELPREPARAGSEGDVIPNNQLGGTTVNIIIQGDVNDAEAFYRKVNEARNQFERRGN